jgi:hypothetical protein
MPPFIVVLAVYLYSTTPALNFITHIFICHNAIWLQRRVETRVHMYLLQLPARAYVDNQNNHERRTVNAILVNGYYSLNNI